MNNSSFILCERYRNMYFFIDTNNDDTGRIVLNNK